MGSTRPGARGRALDELAPAHAVALRLHDAGVPDEAIAIALDVPLEAVGPLLGVAERKLRAAMERVTRVRAVDDRPG